MMGRLNAARLLEEFKSLVRSCGGWERISELLSPEDRARLAVVIAETSERNLAKTEADERAYRQSQIDLDDPALQRELEQLALKQIGRYPARVALALAHAAPDALADVLRQHGWTVGPSTAGEDR